MNSLRPLRPDRDRPASRDQQAGLCLVDAYEPGDTAAWLVNERVTRRQCAACASRITDLPEHHVPPQWTPRQAWATKGRSQVPVDQGPTATRARGPHAGDLRERHSGSPAAEQRRGRLNTSLSEGAYSLVAGASAL